MKLQWYMFPPVPENFDHHIDLFYQWLDTRNPQWVERGVYGALVLRHGMTLDLCCGDGFNARNFYSKNSKEVIACDYDSKAISLARRKNSADNIKYIEADIRTNMPDGRFDNVMWDAAIEHFTEVEIKNIMAGIKSRLSDQGVLSGYTLEMRSDHEKHLSHHQCEFKGVEDLRKLLSAYFVNTVVFKTNYGDRTNLYFWASDGMLPLKEWV
jgi:ubiquinone/menaquinone biosynthesis C-methylase UbiE